MLKISLLRAPDYMILTPKIEKISLPCMGGGTPPSHSVGPHSPLAPSHLFSKYFRCFSCGQKSSPPPPLLKTCLRHWYNIHYSVQLFTNCFQFYVKNKTKQGITSFIQQFCTICHGTPYQQLRPVIPERVERTAKMEENTQYKLVVKYPNWWKFVDRLAHSWRYASIK